MERVFIVGIDTDGVKIAMDSFTPVRGHHRLLLARQFKAHLAGLAVLEANIGANTRDAGW